MKKTTKNLKWILPSFLFFIAALAFMLLYQEYTLKIKLLNELIQQNARIMKKYLILDRKLKSNKNENNNATQSNLTNFNVSLNMSRDFYRYECKTRQRIGGYDLYVNRVPDKLYRVEGAWFICLDEGVAPVRDNCLVLSFGVNDDESFDREMNLNFRCQVESFDPFIENKFFSSFRSNNIKLSNQVTMQVNEKWRFHRIGLVGDLKSIKNKNQIGWMARLDEILNYTNLNNKVIDIFKMDIENGEWEFFLSINTDYLCKYVKQFMLETHTPEINPSVFNVPLQVALKFLRKLEKCFLLFHRDTRFYKDGKVGKYGFWKTEFQEPIEYKIDLKEWKNEMEIIDFMVTYGELYFINRNFLK